MRRKRLNNQRSKSSIRHGKKEKQIRPFIIRRVLYLLAILFVGMITLCVLFVTVFRLMAMIRETSIAEDVAPKSGKFVKAADLELFVQDEGPRSGKTIIFIHGVGAWSESWRGTTDELTKRGFRTVAIDVPPFGFSEKRSDGTYKRIDQAKRIIGVLDALSISSAVFVGHSFGSGATVEAAMMAPERVDSLVLVDAALGLGNKEEKNHPSLMATILSNKPLRDTLMSTTLTNPLLSKFWLQKFIANQDAATDTRVKMFQKPLVVKGSTEAVGAWARDFYSLDMNNVSSVEENYKRLSVPVLIIWGGLDTVTPLEQGEHLTELIPGSELAVLQNVGHIPQIENVELFNKTLVSFVTR